MRRLWGRTVAVATWLPAVVLARGASAAGRHAPAASLGRWVAPAPRIAPLATVPAWLLVVLRGLLYPLVGAGDLEHSWGGPTLAGAWVTHLVISVAVLLAVSFAIALATNRRPTATGRG